MIAELPPSLPRLQVATHYSIGVSNEYKEIGNRIRSLVQSDLKSPSIFWQQRCGLKNEVKVFQGKCSAPGWDGEEAMPISPETVEASMQLIDALPANISLPELTPEIDGSILFEWREIPNRIFSLSINGQRITFACILSDNEKNWGEVNFEGNECPDIVDSMLKKYHL